MVTVDGQPTSSQRAGMYRGVSVAVGSHELVWSYRSRSVYWGAAVSGVALLCLAGLAIQRLLRPRSSARAMVPVGDAVR